MKMNQTSKNSGIELRPGTRMSGKWHHNNYIINRKLGAGAIGTVYLCDYQGRPAALKISDKGTSMTVEVNVLKSLEKVQGSQLGPSLLDVDDWVSPGGRVYSFYVMEYLQGMNLSSYIRMNGDRWLGVFMLQLLEDLEKLHESGWVFGDLKVENLVVVSSPPRIRWVDVGGTTRVGRAIKEYTEFYDRGYWGKGSRKAEPSYDLFAFAMVFLNIYYPNRFVKASGPAERLLFRKIDQTKPLEKYRPILKKAIKGHYAAAADMKKDLLEICKGVRKREHYHGRKAKKSAGLVWMESGAIGLLAAAYFLFSLLFH